MIDHGILWRSKLAGARLCAFGRKLFHDRRGQALVEGAIIFPILISLFLGVSEFSEAFTLKRRLETAANTSADLVARTQSVSTSDLIGIKAMVDEIIKPFANTTLGLVITSVVADENNATSVAWSYGQGNGASARTNGSAVTIPPGLTNPNSSIILAEVKYTFHSTLATMIVGDVPMTAEAYLRPRITTQVQKSD
jgi:Flp pilus assembly protein TadG